MTVEYTFAEIHDIAMKALQGFGQKHLQIKLKKMIKPDPLWEKVLPDLEFLLGNRILLHSVIESDMEIPWSEMILGVEAQFANREAPNLKGFVDGELALRIHGLIGVNRITKRLSEYSILPSSIDNDKIFGALVFDCLILWRTHHYFQELVRRLKNDPLKKAAFGITLDSTEFSEEVSPSYQTLRNQAEKFKKDDHWEDDFHLWLEKHFRRPFHRKIQDNYTLDVHNRNLWLTRVGNKYREVLSGDEGFSELELVFSSPTEEEIELTERQKTRIKGLLSEIDGASPETGLSIIECMLQTESSGATKIAEATGYSTKTVSRYIGTKGTEGFLAQIGEEFKSLFDDN